jgi:AcrR family transcriptional regulator
MSIDMQAVKVSYHHGDLRKALLDVATKIMQEEGENALTMRRLGIALGVSRSAAYSHFANKEMLLHAIAEEGYRRFDAALDLDSLPEGEYLTKVHFTRYIKNYVSFALDNSSYYDFIFGGRLWRSPSISSSLTCQAHQSFTNYVNKIEQWKKSGSIPESVDSLKLAQITWSTLHGLSRQIIDGIYADRSSSGALCEAVADLFWHSTH